ncbi:hypothetical protein [Aeromicrobium fastidiosum]|uniref:Uncharacterized protein n=2 Tax=Aeromicrobium fastidiosum TaxID=52699 RepID=A0A641AKB1_9ACTN|nr:hypothetical protein [Aeromicrobium fastidiosum]KAA1376126.1 hypothetical protein ESP62_011825 [Aeromicrobium fastidiosum]
MAALPTGSTLLGYLGWAADETLTAQADEHAAGAVLLVREYTRGKGFQTASDGTVTVSDGIAGVIVTYGARSLSNPTSAREIEAGAFKESPGSPWSFSLVETLVLNNYRRRAG